MNRRRKPARSRMVGGRVGGWTGYLFASPWLLGFLGLTLVPMVISLLLSFCQWDGINVATIRWVGTEHYAEALQGIREGAQEEFGPGVAAPTGDVNVWIALKNTAFYSFLAVPLGLCVSLMLALLLNQKLRGITLFRTIFYMPHVIGGVATIMMWMWVFNPDYGLLNEILRWLVQVPQAFGLMQDWQPPGWLGDQDWSKPALIIMALWGAGGAMLIFLAALQNVPEQLYEAARIDGAGRLRQFWHITVPQISPAIFFNLVMGVIASFQVFNQAYIITGGDINHAGKSLLFYVLYIYTKAFQDSELGYGSALAWILFVIILVFTLLIVRSSRRWVYYEGEEA